MYVSRKSEYRYSPQGLARLAPLLHKLEELARKYQKSPSQVALNWLIAQGNVVPIPGAKNAQQAQQNAGALGWQLESPDWQSLAALSC